MVSIILNKPEYYNKSILVDPVAYANFITNKLSIADETIKIEPLRLTAGFPFDKFEMPEIKFQCVKDKILNGKWEDGCKSTIRGSSINNTACDTIFNIPTKKTPIIEGECFIKHSGKDITYIPKGNSTHVSLFTILNNTFGFNVNNILSIVDFDGEAIFEILGTTIEKLMDSEYLSFLKSRTLRHIYYTLDMNSRGSVIPINYETVTEIIKTLQWVFFDFAPVLADIDGTQINIRNNIGLINPEDYHSGSSILLDTEKMTSWKETTSKMGFKIDEYVENKEFKDSGGKTIKEKYIIEALIIKSKGSGFTHQFRESSALVLTETISLTGTSGGNLISEIIDLNPIFIHAAKAMAKHLDSLLNDKLLEISTIETTPIVPYSKVQIENKNYYCIEAEIPYKDHELFKYKLQEMK